MKLDGELGLCHSNVGLEPESQSFEFNDNNPDSTGCKSRNQKLKENENRVSIDLKRSEENDGEAKIRNFVEPVSHSSQNTESFRKFPNASFPDSPQDIESVKRSPNVLTSDPPKELDSFENSADTYIDKRVKESEPELIVCYKESNYHFIKDICVDEGVPTKDKILFENSVDEKAIFKFSPSDIYENKELKKENIGINVPFLGVLDLPATKESDKVPDKHYQSEDLMQGNKNATDKLADDTYKEMVLPGDKILLQELDTQQTSPSVDEGYEIELNNAEVSGEPESHSKYEESENRIEESVLATPALAVAVGEPNSDILVSDSTLQNGSITSQLVPSASVACSKEECHQVGGCRCNDTQNTSKPADGKPEDHAVINQVCNSLGESSFSAVGLVLSHISYSGPVPYSGSISLRSDSSTTSTRSFAFPILQSEWNSSPVRMAKADRRHSRKYRGWKQGILCCRF